MKKVSDEGIYIEDSNGENGNQALFYPSLPSKEASYEVCAGEGKRANY